MKKLADLSFSGNRVVVRVDFNVPLDDQGKVTDDTRIKAALPTLKYLLEAGASLVLLSHLGRPKNGPEDKFSLRQIVPNLESNLGREVLFSPTSAGQEASEMASNLEPGQVLLMENVRFHQGETKGDEDLARAFADLGEIYVNDAFGSAHRAHSSTSQIAAYFEEKAPGFLMEAELTNADNVLKGAAKPFVAIMGGAKVSDKIEIIENLLPIADQILVGGGMAYTFFKAKGGDIGNSLVEEDKLELALELFQKAEDHNTELILPMDSKVAGSFSNDSHSKLCPSDHIEDGYMGLDIGEEAIGRFRSVVLGAKTILWNGPMGVFEFSNFAQGTFEIGKAVVEATKKGAFSLIGGGDSAAAIKKLELAGQVSYVSTGGGALLEYFEGKTLPGVKALE